MIDYDVKSYTVTKNSSCYNITIFLFQYLGSTGVAELMGVESTRAGITKLKVVIDSLEF